MNNKDVWPKMEDDFMTIGESGFIAVADGWMFNPTTQEKMDPEGYIYNESGQLINGDPE